MSDDLYQQAIKDLAGRHSAVPPHPDAGAQLDNPLCGDAVEIGLILEGGKVAAEGHRVTGCLLCQAAAGALAEVAPGLDGAGARHLESAVSAMLKQGEAPPLAILAPLGAARPHKSRHNCVLLPFRALVKALGS
jgi:nitrogen fixation NifU-like protein